MTALISRCLLFAALFLAPLAPEALAQGSIPPPPPPPAAASEAVQEEITPVLYLLEDGDSRVYLLGSIHILDAASYPLPEIVEAAYADAELVAFEIDLTDLDAVQSSILERAQYTDGRTLRDVMGKDFAALEERIGATAQALNGFEPWAVQMSIGPLAMLQTGYDAENGVDMHFLNRAKKDGKGRLALETADAQMSAFDGLPEETQMEMLMGTLREWDTLDVQLRDLVSAWKSGKDSDIAAFMNDMPESALAPFLRDRNANWIPEIEAMLERQDDVLVIMGAGHLVGKDSVVAMLRAKGYTVARQ